MKLLRIAMLGTRGVPATFGGVEHHVEQVGARLADRGHEVTVYAQRRYLEGQSLTHHRGMRVVALPTVKARGFEALSHAAMSTVRGLARGHDVFHYHAVGPGLVSPLARTFSTAAVVQTIHGLDADRAKWGGGARGVLNLATWMSARVPHHTVTVSQQLTRHYDDRYDRACTYVTNGVTPKTRREADLITERWGLRGGDYLLFVGRLVPEKRPDLLIRAFADVETDQKLVIAGGSAHTDDYVEELRRLAARDPRVILTGYAYGAELDELFTNASGFVQPSALEGLPLTLLEAMGAGLPLVVSDIAPHLEIIGTDRPGARLFAEGDLGALTHALARLVNGPDAERRTDSRLRTETLRDYDWDACATSLEHVYMTALGLAVPSHLPVGASRRQPDRTGTLIA